MTRSLCMLRQAVFILLSAEATPLSFASRVVEQHVIIKFKVGTSSQVNRAMGMRPRSTRLAQHLRIKSMGPSSQVCGAMWLRPRSTRGQIYPRATHTPNLIVCMTSWINFFRYMAPNCSISLSSPTPLSPPLLLACWQPYSSLYFIMPQNRLSRAPLDCSSIARACVFLSYTVRGWGEERRAPISQSIAVQ